MPIQPRENGMAQNNEVIEEHWAGESLPLWLLAWTSHWWPLAWRPHSTAQSPPPGMDVTSFSSRIPQPSNYSTCLHTTFVWCFFCFSQCLWSLCMVRSHDSQNVALFLKGSLIHCMLCKGLRGGGDWWIGCASVKKMSKTGSYFSDGLKWKFGGLVGPLQKHYVFWLSTWLIPVNYLRDSLGRFLHIWLRCLFGVCNELILMLKSQEFCFWQ